MKGIRLGVGMSIMAVLVGAGAAERFAQGPDAVRAALAAKVDAADKDGASGIAGKDGWLFFVPELRYLSVGPFWGDNAAKVSRAPTAKADPLPVIVDFKDQLAAMGIDLLVVPVPAKAAIYPDMLVDGAKTDAADRVDQAQADFIKLLNDQGVHTLDLTPVYLQYRADHPNKLLYSKTDTHWSGAGIDVAADLIAAEIKKEAWYGGVPKSPFTVVPTKISAKGDIVDMIKSGAPGPETFNLNSVSKSDAAFSPDRTSPLVLLGDSHNLIYSVGNAENGLIATGAGLPENLSAKIGFVPDVVAVMGSGATPARKNLRLRNDNLAGKKMIVWVFTAREFTEGQGWSRVPMKSSTN